MPRPKNANPSYLLHAKSGQARVRIRNGRRYRDIYLGRYKSPESWQKYHQILAKPSELTAGGEPGSKPVEEGHHLTIAALIVRYDDYGRKNGRSSQERYQIARFTQALVSLYGSTAACEFGPNKLRNVRDWIIATGNLQGAVFDRQGHLVRPGGRLSRSYLNHVVKVLVRMFRWAASHELVPAHVHDALTKVEGVRKGREPRVREPVPVRTVDEEHIRPVLAVTPPQIAAMIQVQNLTGMRPDEVTIMRPCDITRTGPVWSYCPSSHKLEWLGLRREILIGPRAQQLLLPWLEGREESAYLFSPREVAEANARALEKRRRRPRDQRVKLSRKRAPREHYDDRAYRQAVVRACRRAGVPVWTPGQLRHRAATEVRGKFGAEAAQLLLGHRNLSTTEIYAEKNRARYVEIIQNMG